MNLIIVCRNCKSTELVYNSTIGDRVCQDCGYWQDDPLYKFTCNSTWESGWQNLTIEELRIKLENFPDYIWKDNFRIILEKNTDNTWKKVYYKDFDDYFNEFVFSLNDHQIVELTINQQPFIFSLQE